MHRNTTIQAATTLALTLIMATSLVQSVQPARAGATRVDAALAPVAVPQAPQAVPASMPVLRQPSDDPANGTWQNDFLRAADLIRQAHPDDLAEVVVGDDSRSGTVSFARAAPADALEQLAGLGSVRMIENLGYTEKQVSDAAEKVYQLAKAELGPEAEINTYYDGSDGNFHVRYQSSGGSTNGYDARLQESMSSQLTLPGDKRLEVESDPADMLKVQNLQGGHVTYFAGGLMCTSAFPVKKNDGAEIGVLTAGHCPGATTQWVPGGGMYFSVQPNSQSTSSSYPGGDFRWLWSREMWLLSRGTDVRRISVESAA